MEECLASADSPDDWAQALEHSVLRNAPKDHDNYSLIGVWLEAQTGATEAADDAVTVMLVNTGNMALTITNIATSGDFAQTNACGVITYWKKHEKMPVINIEVMTIAMTSGANVGFGCSCR